MRNGLVLFWWCLTLSLAGLTLIGSRFGLTDTPAGGGLLFLLAVVWGVLTVALLMIRRQQSRSGGE